MSAIAELKEQRETAFKKADNIVTAAERAKRPLTVSEDGIVNTNLKAVRDLDQQIAQATRNNQDDQSIVAKFKALRAQIPATPMSVARGEEERLVPKQFSREYYDAFYDQATRSGGNGRVNAALYEGATNGGGYAVPIMVDNFIAPLAPTASDIRSIATVIPTTKNLLLPTTAPTGLPTTTQTAELSAFAQSVPSLGQVQLQAYLNALLAPVSLELTEDVPGLEAYMRTVVEAALLEQEDALFVSGTGSNEPQGVVGNCGAGITAEPDGNGNLVSFAGLSALIGTVKAKYLSNASWLMSQSTAIVVRAALAYSGASFEWTRGADGVERLFGYRVAYSASMPTAARGNAPVLFGNWKMGYVVADRGGPAVRLKILDQMFGVNGTLYWLLSRRTDARVWVQEAIQQYNIAAS
jgi:HK97 family phage major capsid protein